MKKILDSISSYVNELNKRIFVGCCFIVTFLIWANYYFQIDNFIDSKNSFTISFISRFTIFLFAFSLPYYFAFVFAKNNCFNNKIFLFLLFIAPAIFSFKIAIETTINFTTDYHWNVYWNQIFYWPIRLVFILSCLFLIGKMLKEKKPFWGFSTIGFQWKPYAILLLLMVPLITFASTQADFLAMYPKLKTTSETLSTSNYSWFFNLLYEISYGLDFISIELFFRGFLIFAFAKFAGKDAILPMACFYCTIHFGKPFFECVSSFFGGMLLGIIALNTRSILGGLFIHLGIAWLMEIGGFLGNKFL